MEKLTPYADILKRCGNNYDKTTKEIFLESMVDPANIYNWKKKESNGVVRWFKLTKMFPGVDFKPGTSTYQIIAGQLGSERSTDQLFLNENFSKALLKIWRHEDPDYIEGYKRIIKTLEKYESGEI